MTEAQKRMLNILWETSDAEEERHPGSGGWVDWWTVADRWGRRVPHHLVPFTASRVWKALERQGLIEDHPDPAFRGLVRPVDFEPETPVDVNGVVYEAGYAYACGYHD